MADRAEIFTIDRAHKIRGPVFEEKILKRFSGEFSRKPWFSIGSHLAKDNPFLTLSDWAENFFGKSYDYISEVVLSFFENLAFFYFYKKNIKKFSGELTFGLSKTLQIRKGESEMKTAKTTSGGYFELSVVKISARSDKVRG